MNDKQFLAAVHELPCMLEPTGDCHGQIEAHHLTDGGRRMGDKFSIPLCTGHHGSLFSKLKCGDAYHKGTKAWERKHGSQKEMVLIVWEALGYKPTEAELDRLARK